MNLKAILTPLLVFLSLAALAQDTLYQKLQSPEFPFEPHLINDDWSIQTLRKEKCVTTYYSKPAWQKGEFVVSNAHSTLLLKVSSVRIVVKHDLFFGIQTNPQDVYKLYKVDVNEKKNRRTCLFSDIKKDMSGHVKYINDTLNIPLKFKKIKDTLYLTLAENLIPGDYVWHSGGDICYTFRID